MKTDKTVKEIIKFKHSINKLCTVCKLIRNNAYCPRSGCPLIRIQAQLHKFK